MTYWLQDKANFDRATKMGYGKNHLTCISIGHVLLPQLDYENSVMRYFCYNCGKEQKNKLRSVSKA